MTRWRRTLLLLVLLFWTAAVRGTRAAQSVQIHNGMGTGQDYLQLPEPERPAYVMGFVNGLFLAPLFGASRQSSAWLETCLEEKSGKQIAEILTQYLAQHPTEQHEQLHAATYRALLQVCPASPINQPPKAQERTATPKRRVRKGDRRQKSAHPRTAGATLRLSHNLL
jgi:hypothetical protein